jgi:hypothetical protein
VKRIRISIAGVMGLVALLALDFALIPALRNVPTAGIRIGLFGELPMVHILAVDLAIVVSGLARRGETSLSGVAFLLFGGTATLLLVAILILAPDLFSMYISNTAGLVVLPGQPGPAIYLIGMGGPIKPIEALLAWGAVTPPLLIPALVAGWMTRGSRLKLSKRPKVP